MKRIGINGHLADAICKTRVLVGEADRSVQVIITPHCRPLLKWLAALPPVAEVVVDEAAVSSDGWGEQTRWAISVDVDTSFARYPDEWVVNFIAKAHGLERQPFEYWFGVWRSVLAGVECKERVFIGRVSIAGDIAARVRALKPGVEVVHWDENANFFDNARAAAGCSIRVVAPCEEAQMLAACGLECLVEYRVPWAGPHVWLFCPPRARLVRVGGLWARVKALLEGVERSAQSLRVAVGIPTLCCGDLLEQSVRALAPQLGEQDEIVIVDNGAQGLVEKLAGLPVRVIESEQNLGVSGSWNRLIRETVCAGDGWDWLVLLNDDVALGPNQWHWLKQALREAGWQGKWLLTGPFQWSVIALNRACIENVGWFDERFFPAYFEDNDYHWRLNAVDAARYAGGVPELEPETRRHSETIARRPEVNRFAENERRFVEKWGGKPGHERFAVAYGKVNRPSSRPAAARVIVCVPTYHRTARLVQAVESLRAQTYRDFEVWVVKDGCATSAAIKPPHVERPCLECDECQRTKDWMRRICEADARFRFYSLPVNAGDGWAARNFILQNTTHELIAYLDDDNWLEPDHLAALVDRLDATGAQMAYTGTQVWRNGKPAERRVHVTVPVFGEIDTSEILHRRELIDLHGGWRDRYQYGNSDWEIVKRWMEAGVTWAHTGRVTHNYRMARKPAAAAKKL